MLTPHACVRACPPACAPSLPQMSASEEEDYERASEESLFRIHILEKRLRRHEEQALHKYYELDTKLRSDLRMAALLSPY